MGIIKKIILILMMTTVLLMIACASKDSINNTDMKEGIEITSINSSIGAVGDQTNDFDTQSFKYTITLLSNEDADLNIVSVNPIVSDKFKDRILSENTIIQVNKIISKGSSLNVSGEIIFNAKGMTKEQIVSLEPFVNEVKIMEERVIEQSF